MHPVAVPLAADGGFMVPPEFREVLGLSPGAAVLFVLYGDELRLRSVRKSIEKQGESAARQTTR